MRVGLVISGYTLVSLQSRGLSAYRYGVELKATGVPSGMAVSFERPYVAAERPGGEDRGDSGFPENA